MAPRTSKTTKKETPCLEKSVYYEPSVWLADFNKQEQEEANQILQRNGWTKFMTAIPPFFLGEVINQFYDALAWDDSCKWFRTVISIFTEADFSKTEQIHLNVSELVKNCFELPSNGKDITSLSVKETDEILKEAVVPGSDTTGTLRVVTLLPKYKILMKIIQKCYFRMISSRDQASQAHKQVMAAMMLTEEFNWESAYLNILVAEKYNIKTDAYMRQGNRVSYLIQESVKGRQIYWKSVIPVASEHFLYKVSRLEGSEQAESAATSTKKGKRTVIKRKAVTRSMKGQTSSQGAGSASQGDKEKSPQKEDAPQNQTVSEDELSSSLDADLIHRRRFQRRTNRASVSIPTMETASKPQTDAVLTTPSASAPTLKGGVFPIAPKLLKKTSKPIEKIPLEASPSPSPKQSTPGDTDVQITK